MQVTNKVVPSKEQMKGFLEPGHDGAIYMLNLLKFKEQAEYEDGRATDLTGAEAYAIYSGEVVGHLAKVGGAPMFTARVERLMLGEVEELRDVVLVLVADQLAVRLLQAFGRPLVLDHQDRDAVHERDDVAALGLA